MTEKSSTTRKIIAVGASGVGKTTLVEALAPLLSLPLIPEVARRLCLEKGYKYPGEVPENEQEAFKFQVLEEQIKSENEHSSFISDRSSLDAWVLWQRWNLGKAMTYDSERYHDLARAQAKHYTHIIYLPPAFPPVEDGFRWTDADYQKQVDRLVRMTLYDWDLLPKTYTVKSVQPEQRLQEVYCWLT